MDAKVKTEQIILNILWAANSESQPLIHSSGLPPLRSDTPAPFQKPLRRRLMTIQGWCGCVSVTVKPIDDVDGQNGLESGGDGSGACFPIVAVSFPL